MPCENEHNHKCQGCDSCAYNHFHQNSSSRGYSQGASHQCSHDLLESYDDDAEALMLKCYDHLEGLAAGGQPKRINSYVG